jgi:hypothetical protein
LQLLQLQWQQQLRGLVLAALVVVVPLLLVRRVGQQLQGLQEVVGEQQEEKVLHLLQCLWLCGLYRLQWYGNSR